jgi:hypothetical protein
MTVSLTDTSQLRHAAFLTSAEVVFPVVDGESHAQRELPINSPVWIPFVQTERYVTYADTLFKQHGRLFYLHCHFTYSYMLILIAKLAKEKPLTLNFALNIRNRFSD